MKTFEGFIYMKLANIGTKSEGPEYTLQLLRSMDGLTEIVIEKKTFLWEPDPALHQFIAEKVVVTGELINKKLQYTEVKLMGDPLTIAAPGEHIVPTNGIEQYLKLEGDNYMANQNQLWVDRMPAAGVPPPPVLKKLKIILHYSYPRPGKYSGRCSTSQFFEFTIKDPAGKVIWQWSKGIKFVPNHNEFELSGNVEYVFPVEWQYFDNAIAEEGTYKVTAYFLSNGGQAVHFPFQVGFVR